MHHTGLIIGIILLVVVVGGIFIALNLMSKRANQIAAEARRRADIKLTRSTLEDLIPRAKQGDAAAEADLREHKAVYDKFIGQEPADSKLAAGYHQAWDEIQFREWLGPQEALLVELLNRYRQAGSMAERIDALVHLLSFHDQWVKAYTAKQCEAMSALAKKHQFDFQMARTELGQLIQNHYNALVLLAATYKPALNELRGLINGTTIHGQTIESWMGGPSLAYPADWNLWVSRQDPEPSLEDFAGLASPESVNAAELSRRADQALGAEEGAINPAIHLTEVQVLLAYARAGVKFLPDQQYDELSQLALRLKLADAGRV